MSKEQSLYRVTAYFNNGSSTFTARHRADESRELVRKLLNVADVPKVTVEYFPNGYKERTPEWTLTRKPHGKHRYSSAFLVYATEPGQL